MIITLICVGVAAAADVNGTNDLGNTNMGNIAVYGNENNDAIDSQEIPIEDIATDDHTDIGTDSSDDIQIEERENSAIDEINETSNIDGELDVEDGNSTYSKIIDFYNHDFKDHDGLYFIEALRTHNEILELYDAGHTTDNIGVKCNMTAEQVQDLADIQFPHIKEDASSEAIYKLYGSHTLDEISQNLGLSKQNVLVKISAMREGHFGVFFKKIILRRYFILLSENHKDLIIK